MALNDPLDWFDLPNGYAGSVRYSRVARRTRFIVLAPAKDPSRLRPTLCAGDFVDGQCILDHGVIDDAMKLELESLCHTALELRSIAAKRKA